MSQLEIKNLHVTIEGKEILKGLSLSINQGEIHAIMGPNGTGKSTLAYTLMGHPSYTVTEGEVTFKGQNVLELEPDERSRLGMFLAFQYPVAIPGVTVANFLRTAINAMPFLLPLLFQIGFGMSEKRGYSGLPRGVQS
jgi:Fe-S cluster assembly ATP-binding protein